MRTTARLSVERLEPRDTPSAAGSLDYLRRVMDQYHDRFIVYEDVSSAGNHFHAFARLPDAAAAADVNGSWADRPRSGATAIRNVFTDTAGPNFAGFYFQNGVLPDPGPPVNPQAPGVNFGTVPNAGVNLTGATALTFWARGERGGERVEFFMGGVGRHATTGAATAPFPDSTPVVKVTLTLAAEWRQYRIDLGGRDLSYVLGGFGWVANDAANPGGATFYLDDIGYELGAARQAQRLNEPRFLRSFTTEPRQPDLFDANTDDDIDFALRNLAFTYDNAVALLAFLADGTADSVRRAGLIGDAFVYAAAHDRTITDGRVRTAYAAGDIALPPGWVANGKVGTAPVPGFYVEAEKRFYEVEQGAVDTGNNAWAMLALLGLYRKTGKAAYLDTARGIGRFILSQRATVGTYQGFLGGLTDPESAAPRQRPYASTEHNLDVAAAFAMMAELTGEAVWRDGAAHARAFVEAMWDEARGCYLTGTADASTRNTTPGQLPLDAQAWAVLAIPDALSRHPRVLDCAFANHAVTADGYAGFDFNEDRDGVWFEGTGQMAVALEAAGRPADAARYRRELLRAEQALGGGAGLTPTPRDKLTTGFGFQYYRRLHIGATGWNVLAQLRYNPFTGAAVGRLRAFAVAADAGGGPQVSLIDPTTGRTVSTFFAYDPGFRGGVRVATGDLTGDGIPDVVTIPGPGGGAHVKVFNGIDNSLVAQFFAYLPQFTGGGFVAVGDVDGDGIGDIVTSADAGGGPHVQVFRGTDFRVLWSFFAYEPGFRGGVRVTAADLTGDGRADIVTAAGRGGGPHVQVFDGATLARTTSFFAYTPTFSAGIYVAAADLTGDGLPELVTGAGAGGGPHVQAFSSRTGAVVRTFFAFDPGFTGGVRVAARDYDDDGRADVVTAAGPGGGSHVRVLRGDDGSEMFGGLVLAPGFRGGMFVG